MLRKFGHKVAGRAVLAAGVMMVLLAGPVLAMDFARGYQVALEKNRVIAGDWYAAGRQVRVEGRVTRDAFIAGQWVEIRGAIGADLNCAGETIEVRAPVGATARLAGRFLRLASDISGETLALGDKLTLDANGRIRGDVLAAARRIEIYGILDGLADLSAETVELNGTLTGHVVIRAEQINAGPQTRILGRMTYYAPRAMEVRPGAQVPNEVQWIKTEPRRKGVSRGLIFVGALLAGGTIAGIWVIGALLISLARDPAQRFVQNIRDQPWRALGWGALTLLGFPVAVAILFASVVGIPLALFLILIFFLIVVLSQATAGYFTGMLLFGERARRQPFLAYSVGLLVFAFLEFIPGVGCLLVLASLIVALGAGWLAGKHAA